MKQPNHEFDFKEAIIFPDDNFYNLSQINGLKDVEASGHGQFFEKEERLHVDLHIKGTMIVPCALSAQDVDYPFEIDETEVFAFDKPKSDEDVIEAKRDTAELLPVIFSEIMMAIPMRVVKEGATLLRSGKGWRVIDEEDLVEEDQIDPRLAVLKDYFKNEE